jgi:hypothetical protein
MPPSAPVPIPETRHAELRRALDSLSKADLQRLLHVAELRAAGTGLTSDDLLHEAVTRMFSGSRAAWSAETLVGDLFGIIRSIASSKRESLRQRRQREQHFHEAKPAPATNVDQLDLVVRVRQLRARLEAQGDVEAVLVLDGMAQGLTMKEAAEDLGLAPKQLDAIRKRITRQRADHDAQD